MRIASIQNEVSHQDFAYFLQVEPLWYAAALLRNLENSLVYGNFDETVDLFLSIHNEIYNVIPPPLQDIFRLQLLPGRISQDLESFIGRYHYYNSSQFGSFSLSIIRDKNKLAQERYVGNLFYTKVR